MTDTPPEIAEMVRAPVDGQVRRGTFPDGGGDV